VCLKNAQVNDDRGNWNAENPQFRQTLHQDGRGTVLTGASTYRRRGRSGFVQFRADSDDDSGDVVDLAWPVFDCFEKSLKFLKIHI
jgi:hypothetical protein